MSNPPASRARIGLDVRLTYYTRGGIARYVRQLASLLPDLAPDLEHVHFYRRQHTARFSDTARRVECWTPAHHRWERYTLGLELAPYRLRLLHSPDFIPPKGRHGRTVITVHDLTFLRYPEFLTPSSRRYYNDQIRWAVQQADAISADSHATAGDLQALLGVSPDKVAVIHLGLGPEFSPAGPETAGNDAEALASHGLTPGYLLFVGTFEPRKNAAGLLRAYAALVGREAETPPLVMVGRTGWLFAETATLITSLGLEARVRRIEELPERDLPAVYRGAAALALPSHYEGFGFPVLEAMGCGTPAVIANRASLPEIAGEAALAVEPDDVDALADALRRVLSDSELRAMLIARGLARARTFTWQATARATLALYRKLLAN